MVCDPSTETPRTQCAAHVNVIPLLELHRFQAPNPNTGIARAGKDQRVCSRLWLNDHSHQCPILDWQRLVPTLIKYPERNIDNHMANWKVIEIVSGNIEVVSWPAAGNRPGTHERLVWEGEAADKAEALQSAEKADPRVDLEWMRIRHERDLEIW